MKPISESNRSLRCSFCQREEKEVALLLTAQDANICNECVERSAEIFRRQLQTLEPAFDLEGLSPKSIKSFIDQYVIGQDYAKKVLSVAVYNHYKRLRNLGNTSRQRDDVELEKSNILMVGETGTGKTLIAKTIARLLNVPFTIVDATAFTMAGYVGEDVESILSRLLQVADYDVAKAERGIVFIDEIDKISKKGDNPSLTRDVSGEGVQQALLKLLEGTVVLAPPQGGRKHPEQKMISIDTTHILFICGGSFVGLEQIIQRRLTKQTIGFTTAKAESKSSEKESNNAFAHISPQDLKKFGLIPEFVGRLPIVCHLDALDEKEIKQILTDVKNSLLRQYERMFEMDGVKMNIGEDAIDFIVEQSILSGVGARGLRSVCDRIFNPLFFNIDVYKKKGEIRIDRKTAEKFFYERSRSRA